MTSGPISIAARYLFPVEGPPIADALLTIERGRIAAVGPRDGRTPDVDLGNAAITPGFVNTHTHLELASIPGGDPDRPEDEIAWLKRVIAQRRDSAEAGVAPDATIAANLRAALEAGTTLIADTTTAGRSWGAIAEAPVRGIVFAEVLGLKRARGVQTEHEATAWLNTIRPEDKVAACALAGLSPHAPYSTADWLYYRAATSRVPLSTHLAEMPEELELLADRTGPLREFLEWLGAWDDDWEPIGPRPADYLRKGDLRNADWLIAHGNYLEPEDFWQLRPEAAPDGQRVAVAYCPRTHARFGHDPHPFRQMLARGVIVCLGTDSLASTATLGILDELRFLHRRHPDVSGAMLLTMATLFGAWALHADVVTGSLKPGKSADLAVIPLPDRDDGGDPHRLLLESDEPVRATLFEGQIVHGPKWF